jgi:hypothetical protein
MKDTETMMDLTKTMDKAVKVIADQEGKYMTFLGQRSNTGTASRR